MTKDNRTSLKASHGAHNRTQPHKRGLLLSFIIFMAWVAGIGLLLSLVACQPVNAKPIATDDNSGYHSLTTKLLAVKPSRHSLAIFVPKTCLTTNQQATTGMNKNTSVFIQARHISSAVTGANIYDGLIEPNTTAFTVNKLNRLVTVVKTRHPIFMGDNKLTKLLGGYHA
ncbi:hypothetical protein [Psychrobacter sp. JB193]|uniref:hypothetical protein n=1 Tax=Psychrobacter TaxID=497 RepID=UPI000BAB21B2|nr:hypothetical protein [Psychrobacter sp. JB193]PAT64642.1 hypothetical protein CIK80_06105 [Psychrobacter sp. JB193]